MSTQVEHIDQPTAVALLRDRIDEWGGSARAFARDVLLRDPRTVRRWLAGDSPVPAVVVRFLLAPWPRPVPKGAK